MQISRERAAKLGQETVRILREGQYRSETGAIVELSGLRQRAVEGTRSYPPDALLPPVGHGDRATRIEVTSETTLAAARRLVDQGLRVAALNFASARHPGGGFLNGSRAQEESLARSSGLYACLVGNPMYELHQAQHDALYTNYAIYSPDVPVIRTDEGTLLDQPWPCSFITSPAVNAKVVLDRDRRAARRSKRRWNSGFTRSWRLPRPTATRHWSLALGMRRLWERYSGDRGAVRQGTGRGLPGRV